MVTHNADSLNARENAEELSKIFLISVLSHFITQNPIGILKHFNLIGSDFTDNSYAETRTRERLSPNKFLRNTEFFAYCTNLVLKQICKRLNNSEKFNVVGSVYSVMMSFDNIGITLTRLDTVRINSTLCKVTELVLLSDFVPENVEKFGADNLPLLLRVNHTFKLFKENIAAIYSYKIHIKKACECFFNKVAFIFTH